MTEKSNPSFQKARDEALRALVLQGGLTSEQVSGLKLDQVHLASSTLVIEPDEFAPSPASASGRAASLKLSGELQRALIAWLVVRPDGPNDHLFPGTDLEGLDVATISQVIAATESDKVPQATEPVGTTPPPSAEKKRVSEPPPEPAVEEPPRRPAAEYPRSPRRREGEIPIRERKDERPPPPPSAATPPEESQAVSLDEIQALRERLGEVYDAWAPAAPEVEPSRQVEAEYPADVTELGEPPEEPAPTLEEREPEPIRQPRGVRRVMPRPRETPVARPVAPGREARAAGPEPYPQEALSDRLRRALRSSDKKLTLNISYRAAAIGGAVLALVCCLGLIITGGTMLFRAGGPAGLLAGETTVATPTPSETALAATSVPSPSPSPTPTPVTPFETPSATPAVSPAPADTPALAPTPVTTPTPIVIVVTATPTPEPPPTATPVPTDTPVGGPPAEPTATPTSALKYPAPVLLEPEDGGVVPGVYTFLKWEPVGPLADTEWYALRLVYLQQGEPVYQGDWTKVSEWRVPERFYYQADGPALEYRWYVFIERENPDGSITQISPESETFTFRWE